MNSNTIVEIMLATFRLAKTLTETGDVVTKDLNITSAKWKVLGAINYKSSALTVSQVARLMGLSRQAVQRIANELKNDGLITFENNPKHEKAKLLALTRLGKANMAKMQYRQIKWAALLADGQNDKELEICLKHINRLNELVGQDDILAQVISADKEQL